MIFRRMHWPLARSDVPRFHASILACLAQFPRSYADAEHSHQVLQVGVWLNAGTCVSGRMLTIQISIKSAAPGQTWLRGRGASNWRQMSTILATSPYPTWACLALTSSMPSCHQVPPSFIRKAVTHGPDTLWQALVVRVLQVRHACCTCSTGRSGSMCITMAGLK